jgi:hypothetical protein
MPTNREYCPRLVRLAAILLQCLVLLQSGLGRAESQGPRVAVFQIEDKTERFNSRACQQLASYLRGKLGEEGVYRVVPTSLIREKLVELKRRSYDNCFDQKCQIEVGRELAAEKSLATEIVSLGANCAIVATLFDLRGGIAERAATVRANCTVTSLGNALDTVVRKLRSNAPTPDSSSTYVRQQPVQYVDQPRPSPPPTKTAKRAPRTKITYYTESDGQTGIRTFLSYSTLVGGLGLAAASGILIGLTISRGEDAQANYNSAATLAGQQQFAEEIGDANYRVQIGAALGLGALVSLGLSIYLFASAPSPKPYTTVSSLRVSPNLANRGLSMTGAF